MLSFCILLAAHICNFRQNLQCLNSLCESPGFLKIHVKLGETSEPLDTIELATKENGSRHRELTNGIGVFADPILVIHILIYQTQWTF